MISGEEDARPNSFYLMCELRAMRSLVRTVLKEDLVAGAAELRSEPRGNA